ncbi:hypothetical protein D3C73_1370110 [compost metagenome]
MTTPVSWRWGSHAHFIGSLGLRSVPGLVDRVVVGNPADQAQTSVAGNGPGDGDLVSPDGIRRLPVHLPGGHQASAQPQGARSSWWLVGADGGARPGR